MSYEDYTDIYAKLIEKMADALSEFRAMRILYPQGSCITSLVVDEKYEVCCKEVYPEDSSACSYTKKQI